MGQVVYRANLSAPSFPFLAENFGKTVIVKGPDQNSPAPTLVSKADMDSDLGVPQLIFCENVMPTGQGYQSIGYSTLFAGVETATIFKRIVPLQAADGRVAYLAQTTDGHVYIRTPSSVAWESQGGGYTGNITTAYWFGRTQIYFEKQYCMYYDFDIHVLVAYTITPLDETKILGIFTAAGYFCAYDETTIYWAVPDLFPPDFTPSLITGAGSISIAPAQSSITACLANNTGGIIYTKSNAVVMAGSGNAMYPFQFRELAASGGIKDAELAVIDPNTTGHYVYTTSGMQMVTAQQAQTVFPELTDFLAGSVYEAWNYFSHSVSTFVMSGSSLTKKLNVVADRYLCISYGQSGLEFVLIYDIVLKRWGKIRKPHVDLFEIYSDFSNVNDPAKRSIGLLQADGTVLFVNWSTRASSSSGVLVLGKYQYVRTRMLQLDKVSIENIEPESTTTLHDSCSIDGKTQYALFEGSLNYQGGQTRDYYFRATGVNHSLVLAGAFNLNSVVLHFNVHGRR